MQPWKWKFAGVLLRLPIFYKVVAANSVMAGVVIATLLLNHDDAVAVGVVAAACGIVNAVLVRAAFAAERLSSQQREVLAWTIARTERERGRVAAALHDGAAQRLAALALRASGDRGVSSEATAVMQDLCDTASKLQPPAMRLLGLGGALNWYAKALEQRTGLHVDCTLECPVNAIDPDVALGAFRLVEDVLDSAADDGTDQARLSARAAHDHLEISVRVDRAFSRSERFRLAERTAMLGGVMNIMQDGRQTVIRTTIPGRMSHA
ncbi:MAG: hypothetical protein WEF86_08040 [Gemmatimonadota bacterium]